MSVKRQEQPGQGLPGRRPKRAGGVRIVLFVPLMIALSGLLVIVAGRAGMAPLADGPATTEPAVDPLVTGGIQHPLAGRTGYGVEVWPGERHLTDGRSGYGIDR